MYFYGKYYLYSFFHFNDAGAVALDSRLTFELTLVGTINSINFA